MTAVASLLLLFALLVVLGTLARVGVELLGCALQAAGYGLLVLFVLAAVGALLGLVAS